MRAVSPRLRVTNWSIAYRATPATSASIAGAIRSTGFYVAGEELAFIKVIGAAQREQRQADLLVALMLHLQTLSKERLGAPVFTLYAGPRTPVMAGVLDRLRQGGIQVMEVVDVTAPVPDDQLVIPHDGHPTALQISLISTELIKRLGVPR